MTTPVDTANSASASNTNESGHVKVRRGTEIAEEVSAHGVFSKDTVTALEDQPEVLVEVGDFRKDLNNFAARFLALTVLFYFLMALYYRWQLDWTWINAIYFSVITFSTCGYGDKLPHTDTQRLFTAMWIIIGIAATSNLIGVVSAIMTEQEKQKALDLRNALARKERKKHDKLDEKVIKDADGGLGQILKETYAFVRYLFDTVTFYRSFISMISNDGGHVHDKIASLRLKYFDELQELRYATFLDFCILVGVVVFATIFMMHSENWTSHLAFYWSVVTVSTVGYGDFSPTHDGSKLFTCVYVFVGGYYFIKTISGVVWVPIKMLSLKNEIRVIRQFEVDMSAEKFDNIINHPLFTATPHLRSSKEMLSKAEFVIALLNMMNKLNDDDVGVASDIFDAIDISGDGTLSVADLATFLPPPLTQEEAERLQLEASSISNPTIHLIRGIFRGKSAMEKGGRAQAEAKLQAGGGANIVSAVAKLKAGRVAPSPATGAVAGHSQDMGIEEL